MNPQNQLTQSWRPYPLAAFHLPTYRAAQEMLHHVKAPDALVGLALLNAQAVSCQALIDVRLPTGQVRPVSLNTAGIAESGERKTTVDDLAMYPIYERDELRAKKFEADYAAYDSEQCTWLAIDAGIRKNITKATQNGEPVEELRRRITEHRANAPVRPRLRQTLRQNASERAIMDALQGDGESIAFISDEGETILKGGAMNQIGLRNKGWDGARMLVFSRANSENIIARNPRVSVSFFVQEAVLREFIERRGNVIRGSGHWARYLIAWPASTQGFRHITYIDTVWEHLPEFHARVDELQEEYDRGIETGAIKRTIVEFSDEAKIDWIALVNHIEVMLRPHGYLSDMKDFASKAAELVGRVAAIQHWFSKQEGKISVDTLNRAWAIVEWHLHEFKRIFSPQCTVPQAQVDAQAVEHYLLTHVWNLGYQVTAKNGVLHKGPVRPSSRFDAALDHLCAVDRVRIVVDPKRKRYIHLNPQYFGSLGAATGIR